MIGSIDCTKWPWAQCLQAYRTQFSKGDSSSEPFILLEAVASQDLWIWHAFFAVAGSNNDVNVLRQSPVLNDLKVGKAPEVPFVANDMTYKWGYYLTNGIYPEWAVLMKSILQPGSNNVKRIKYKQAHEAARKDVERAFGVLKKKWAIVRTPARSRSLKRITHLMYTCIILYNMIHKEKGKTISLDFYPEEQHREDDPEDILCPLVAGACIQICPKNPVNFSVDNVRVAKLLGASKTFRGMVLKVDTVVGSIKRIENAKVLVIARGVDTTATETSLIHKVYSFISKHVLLQSGFIV
ncbi:ALP1-like protein [Tanacetum coccineum]